MIPQIGQMVRYKLSPEDAAAVNRRRNAAHRSMLDHHAQDMGVMVHVGNPVAGGDTYPMLIVRCWGQTEVSSVNGQVFLDGNDTLWVTSVAQGEAVREWKDLNL